MMLVVRNWLHASLSAAHARRPKTDKEGSLKQVFRLRAGILIGNTSFLLNLTLVNVGVAASQIAATVEPWARGDFGQVDMFFAPFGTAATNVRSFSYHVLWERISSQPCIRICRLRRR
jgi:hypothetical protein